MCRADETRTRSTRTEHLRAPTERNGPRVSPLGRRSAALAALLARGKERRTTISPPSLPLSFPSCASMRARALFSPTHCDSSGAPSRMSLPPRFIHLRRLYAFFRTVGPSEENAWRCEERTRALRAARIARSTRIIYARKALSPPVRPRPFKGPPDLTISITLRGTIRPRLRGTFS